MSAISVYPPISPVAVIQQDPSDPARTGEFDVKFPVPVSISVPHHEIHEGDNYRVCASADVLNGGTLNVLFVAPNTAELIHMTFAIDHEFETRFEIFEDIASYTSAGALVPRNANRNVADANTVVVTIEQDITAEDTSGAILLVDETGGSGKKFGGTSNHDGEWVLKANTNYLFRATNNSGSASSNINIQLDWYEHTDS